MGMGSVAKIAFLQVNRGKWCLRYPLQEPLFDPHLMRWMCSADLWRGRYCERTLDNEMQQHFYPGDTRRLLYWPLALAPVAR